MKFSRLSWIFLVALQANSQKDSLKDFTFSGSAELYYSYDFSKPQNHEKPAFIYNHKRHNEINLNFAHVKAHYQKNNVRGNLALMVGNYAHYNLINEPTWAQFVYEANVGVKLSKKHNLWLDAGIMPSHIGFESAIGANCWNLTRSLMAENSPYFETGVKIGYVSKDEKLSIAAFYLNGWQKVQRPNNMQKPSFGTQISYKPSKKILFNYSTFLGSDQPDQLNAFRNFHNLYVQYEPTSKFGIIAGFDIGSDKYTATNYDIWYTPVLILRQAVNDKTTITLRGEYYHDPKQIIVATATNHGFQVVGLSANVDYQITNQVKWRFEAKWYHAKDQLFKNQTENYSLTTCLSIKLGKDE